MVFWRSFSADSGSPPSLRWCGDRAGFGWTTVGGATGSSLRDGWEIGWTNSTAGGEFAFDVPIVDGRFEVAASLGKGAPSSKKVALTAGNVATVDLVLLEQALQSTPTAVAHVMALDGSPMAGFSSSPSRSLQRGICRRQSGVRIDGGHFDFGVAPREIPQETVAHHFYYRRVEPSINFMKGLRVGLAIVI